MTTPISSEESYTALMEQGSKTMTGENQGSAHIATARGQAGLGLHLTKKEKPLFVPETKGARKDHFGISTPPRT